jgi:septal ring factor EnvC (AmiA/AmiB activator)
MPRLLRVTLLIFSLPAPGCIVYDMRDHLAQSNNRLASMQLELAQTTRELTQVNANLQASNETLSEIRQRLEVLDSINNSLISLDNSLKAIRAAIEKLPILGPAAKEASPKETLPTQPSNPGK